MEVLTEGIFYPKSDQIPLRQKSPGTKTPWDKTPKKIKRGFCPTFMFGGFCPMGFCPRGIMSEGLCHRGVLS